MAGIVIALVGLMAVAASLIGNVVVADEAANIGTLAWTFGLGTVGFAAVMLGIATTLVGILVRLWLRVDAVKAALSGLKPDVGPDDSARIGDIETAYGPATVTKTGWRRYSCAVLLCAWNLHCYKQSPRRPG